ncbi:MAG TPA: hypothetical protein VL993_08255, partial [Stellaceae bacterium]|nr:hypothetical protein [Stellaceae bacterium]
AAGKAFVIATFLVTALGAALVHRALFRRWSAWPCLVFLLLYNRLLLWGVLNYLFGLGLALCAFALMLALDRRGLALRLAVGVVAVLVLYLAHLMAFGVYAVLVVGAALRVSFRRAVLAALPLLPPIALMLAWGGGGGGMVSFAEPWRKLDLLFSVFDLYHRPFDIACFVLIVATLGFAYCRRWLVLAPSLAVPLAMLALLYLVSPSQMLGASGIDRRFPLALALIVVAGSAWAAPRPALERGLLAAAAVMFLLRLGTVALSWQASAREYAAILPALDALPAGARVAVAAPPEATNVSATPLVHLPVLAAALRDAFVPTLFAIPGQQPIAFAPDRRAVAVATGPDLLWRALGADGTLDPRVAGLLAHYDYVAVAGVRPFDVVPRPGLVPVFETPRFKLFRLGG